MKKSSFLGGAFIVTAGIIISKIIGLIYVIPFYSIIGDKGGALYGYAYAIYGIFLSLSSSGIPLAISKIISEYNALGYYYIKEKVYKIGRILITGVGVFSFLLIMIFAEQIASFILGDLEGGNTIKDVSLVIRIIATALLIVPLQSVTRGYLQGHNFMSVPSISTVIEQLVRVLVLLLGSFMVIKVFNLSLETGVGVAVFAATLGALTSYLYLVSKITKAKKTNDLKANETITRKEAKIKTKDLVKKLIFYALPFIMIELFKSAYAMIDTFTVVRTMASLGFGEVAETTIGVMSTWAPKLNMIIISIAIGITISLTPNIAASFAKNDLKDISKKVNQAIQSLLFVCVPLTLGLFFLSQSVWVIFYGYNELNIDIFKYFIFIALSFSLFTVLVNLLQSLNNTKLVILTLLGSFIGKITLNIPAMHLMDNLGLAVYYGPIFVTIITQIIPIVFILYILKRKYNIEYKTSTISATKILLSSAIMMVSMMIINLLYSAETMTRFESIFVVIIYSIIGGLIYLFVTYKNGIIKEIFGEDIIQKFIKYIPFISKNK